MLSDGIICLGMLAFVEFKYFFVAVTEWLSRQGPILEEENVVSSLYENYLWGYCGNRPSSPHTSSRVF